VIAHVQWHRKAVDNEMAVKVSELAISAETANVIWAEKMWNRVVAEWTQANVCDLGYQKRILGTVIG
jgi:hypothetical protein